MQPSFLEVSSDWWSLDKFRAPLITIAKTVLRHFTAAPMDGVFFSWSLVGTSDRRSRGRWPWFYFRGFNTSAANTWLKVLLKVVFIFFTLISNAKKRNLLYARLTLIDLMLVLLTIIYVRCLLLIYNQVIIFYFNRVFT